MKKSENKTIANNASKRIVHNSSEDMLSKTRIHPELKQLAINSNTKGYLSLYELEHKMFEDKNIDEELFEKIQHMESYADIGGGELLLNYDLQFRKQIDEINKLKQMNGDMMDDKDIEILQNKIEKSFAAGMAEVANNIDGKISNLENQIKDINKQAKQSCKDGNCTIEAIKSLREDIGDITNIATINDDKLNSLESNIAKMNETSSISNNETIKGINEKIETICTGVDCLTKTFEDKENTVTCPACGGKFIWDNQTNCPLCQVALEAVS